MAADAETAGRLLQWIIQQKPGIDDGLAYDLALRIARWARVCELRPELVVALVWHESRFDPRAVSATNDHGLCQLHGRAVYDIDENLRAGCAHLAGAIRTQAGDEWYGLCVYNGGPNGPRYGQCQGYARDVLALADGVGKATSPRPSPRAERETSEEAGKDGAG